MSTLVSSALAPGALTAVFQPVVDTEPPPPRLRYLEGLVRGPREIGFDSAERLFSQARLERAEALIDRAAIRAILIEARKLPLDVPIGLNVHASTLATDFDFLNFLCDTAQECWIDPERLVVEVVEHGEPRDPDSLREALAALRHCGVRIALDDLGRGQSNYMLVLECRPDYLKLDRFFVHDVDLDPMRRAILGSVVLLARSIGAVVVAEGVETRAQLRTVREAGIQLVQGFLPGSPQPASAYDEAWATRLGSLDELFDPRHR